MELRHRLIILLRISRGVRVSEPRVSRVMARAGLSGLSGLEPAQPVQRYELQAPRELLHVATTEWAGLPGETKAEASCRQTSPAWR